VAADAPHVKKPWYKRWWVWAIAAVVLVAAVSGGSSSKKDSSSKDGSQASISDSSGSDSSKKTDKGDGCGTTATRDCTPTVGRNGRVRVDALIWKLKSVRAAESLGDPTYGLGANADGHFVIVTLRVHSDRNESATLTQDVFKLESPDGTAYDADTEGTTAAIGAGEQPFFFEDLGPDANHTGIVVFDVPDAKLHKKLKLRFNELGFGETHGYIRLPSLW
jgi:hypothetical protein